MQTIPIFFTFDTNFVLAANVAIHSMLRHASQAYHYDLYVFHTKLRPRHQRSLQKSIKEFTNATIHFINVSEYDEMIKKLENKSHFSKEIFYKLIAPDILPQYDRIICSDVDVIFLGDISTAYFLFPDEKFYYAGVTAISATNNKQRMVNYQNKFNEKELKILEGGIAAGFMLINLKEIRNDHKQDEIINYYVQNYKNFYLPEQDCITLTCWPYIKYIPMEYNLPTAFYSLDMENDEFFQGNPFFAGNKAEALAKFRNGLAHPIQLHYAGFNKPWNSFGITRQKDWMEALMDVPAKEGILLYLATLPYNLLRRLKRYSLKRFLRKLSKKIKKG